MMHMLNIRINEKSLQYLSKIGSGSIEALKVPTSRKCLRTDMSQKQIFFTKLKAINLF